MSNDDNVREMSSSGGVFTNLAKKTIEDGGVVFGAVFDDKMVLRHIAIDSIDDIPKLTGSKYVQSDISNCYTQVRNI